MFSVLGRSRPHFRMFEQGSWYFSTFSTPLFSLLRIPLSSRRFWDEKGLEVSYHSSVIRILRSFPFTTDDGFVVRSFFGPSTVHGVALSFQLIYLRFNLNVDRGWFEKTESKANSSHRVKVHFKHVFLREVSCYTCLLPLGFSDKRWKYRPKL